MLTDDIPLRVQLISGFTVPPVLTVVCWLAGRRMARASGSTATKSKAGFWSMLLAAYVVFALALAGRHFLAKREQVDPSSLLVQ
jgi:hypothetical protein